MLPADVAALATRQRGIVGRAQLRDLLDADHRADDLVRSGDLERIERGVYRVPGGADLPEHAAFAAALRARPRATVTGAVVLHLLGVDGFHGAGTFEILTQPGRRLRSVDFAHRRDPDPSRAVSTWGEVRTAGPLDALIDAAALVGGDDRRVLRVAFDQLRARGITTTERARRRVAELRGRAPGAAVLEASLELAGGFELESEGERHLGPLVRCFDPPLEPQVWVTPKRRADFYSRRCRHAVEYLGEADHAAVAARIEDDRRDAEIRDAGVTITYVTRHDLREPEALQAGLAARLIVRAHELGVTPPVPLALPVELRRTSATTDAR